MSGPLTKGALVAYPPTAGAPNPIVTAFQFNPEKMVHTWSQEAPAGKPGVEAGNPMAVARHARRDVPVQDLAGRR